MAASEQDQLIQATAAWMCKVVVLRTERFEADVVVASIAKRGEIKRRILSFIKGDGAYIEKKRDRARYGHSLALGSKRCLGAPF